MSPNSWTWKPCFALGLRPLTSATTCTPFSICVNVTTPVAVLPCVGWKTAIARLTAGGSAPLCWCSCAASCAPRQPKATSANSAPDHDAISFRIFMTLPFENENPDRCIIAPGAARVKIKAYSNQRCQRDQLDHQVVHAVRLAQVDRQSHAVLVVRREDEHLRRDEVVAHLRGLVPHDEQVH